MHEVHRDECLKIMLHGNAEFEATDVILEVNYQRSIFYENCHKVCCKCDKHKQAEYTDGLNSRVVMRFSLEVY